jgi:hypothetical protein
MTAMNWSVDAVGQGYYETVPAAIPEGERAYFDLASEALITL